MFEPPSRETNTPAYVPSHGTNGGNFDLPPLPPPVRRRRWPWVAGAAAFVLVLVGVFAAAVLVGGEREPSTAKPASELASLGTACRINGMLSDGVNGIKLRCEDGRWASVEVPTLDEPGPEIPPRLDQFQLSLRVTSKKCFGSAGCNVKVKVQAGWAMTLDPATTWELTYEVTGDEDGPIIDTMEITGDQYTVNEEHISTPSRSTKLRIKATSIDQVGI